MKRYFKNNQNQNPLWDSRITSAERGLEINECQEVFSKTSFFLWKRMSPSVTHLLSGLIARHSTLRRKALGRWSRQYLALWLHWQTPRQQKNELQRQLFKIANINYDACHVVPLNMPRGQVHQQLWRRSGRSDSLEVFSSQFRAWYWQSVSHLQYPASLSQVFWWFSFPKQWDEKAA